MNKSSRQVTITEQSRIEIPNERINLGNHEEAKKFHELCERYRRTGVWSEGKF